LNLKGHSAKKKEKEKEKERKKEKDAVITYFISHKKPTNARIYY